MTSGRILPGIVGFALPLAAADLLQQSYLLADSVVVGRYAGVDALAAVGASQPLFYLLNALFIGMATAFTIRLAHLKGAGQIEQRRNTVFAITAFTAAWSAACLLFAATGSHLAYRLMGLHGDVGHDGTSFFGTLSLGFPAIFGLSALSAYLRGIGVPRTAMWILAQSSVLNAALVWLFVGPLHLGVRGAALATDAASTAAFLTGLVRTRQLRIPVGEEVSAAATRRELTSAMRLGMPLALQHIALSVGIMVLVWVVQPFGAAFLAAFTVVGRLELFASLIFLNLSGALTAFVAQNRGAGNIDRIHDGLRRSLALTVAVTVAISAAVVLARQPIAAAFTPDQAARDLTQRYIVITYPFFALYTVMVVVHGCLNGFNRTAVPLICTLIAFVAVQVPAAYGLSRHFGVYGVIWAVVIGWSVGLAYTLTAARRFLTLAALRKSDPSQPAEPLTEASRAT